TLGATLDRIAGEKAGIVKPTMPVVSGVTQQAAVDVIRRTCRERGARFIDARHAVRFEREDASGLVFASQRTRYRGIRLALDGRHQIDNARVAVAAYECLMERIGRRPRPAAVRQALSRVRWAGRLERLVPAAGPPALVFDAAHNPAGVEALARHLRLAASTPPVLLFGATSGKPLERMLEPLAALVAAAVISRPQVERGLDAEEVAVVARRFLSVVEVVPDPALAVVRARELAGCDRDVLVAGSLYLVGQVMGLLAERTVPGPVAM
ncbi:MAG TPA: hypothetical protein VD788_10625, partial [Candidatus Polarisedimenticolaceae bacterium]|nr:hypothetical protein [Candidatus Polarisedimenticolaceae bacterium]